VVVVASLQDDGAFARFDFSKDVLTSHCSHIIQVI
jgi:hypothetical protein